MTLTSKLPIIDSSNNTCPQTVCSSNITCYAQYVNDIINPLGKQLDRSYVIVIKTVNVPQPAFNILKGPK